MFDAKKFNVMRRGGDLLVAITAAKTAKAKRDPEKVRAAIGHMFGINPKRVVPNHSYGGLPPGEWLCFRIKGFSVPDRIRDPGGSNLFAAKGIWLHEVEDFVARPVGEPNEYWVEMDGNLLRRLSQEEEGLVPVPWNGRLARVSGTDTMEGARREADSPADGQMVVLPAETFRALLERMDKLMALLEERTSI